MNNIWITGKTENWQEFRNPLCAKKKSSEILQVGMVGGLV